jgi:hypothetical protein
MKRVFISFAIEDQKLRDFLVGQAKNKKSPFEFYDMSVKEPWDDSWKTRCRTKIKGCDGVLAIITNNSKKASGEIWEINCALDESIPVKGIWGNQIDRPSDVPLKKSISVMGWTWDNIANWVNSL